MTTKSKFSCPVLGRVAMTLLMMVCVLSAGAVDVVCTIDMTSTETDTFTCDGGTITKDGSTLYITPNANFDIYSVQGTDQYGSFEIAISVSPISKFCNCTNYGTVNVTFRTKADDVVVTFDKNGHGGDNFIQEITIGSKVTKPVDPSEDGFVFGGWYWDADCTTSYDFDTVLGANTQYTSFTSGSDAHFNLTLYAKWLVYVDGGNCGTGVTWSGYKDVNTGVFDEITISGNGDIAQYAFYGNKNIKGVVINDGVTSIGQGAFYFCSGLTSVTIPASVTSIGQDAFRDCSGLTSVTIPASVTSIGQDAFRVCSGLTSVTIGNSVTNIGEGAFSGCTGLTSVTIGNSVTSIGQDAFRGCSGLTSVTIPNSVTNIGQGAFYFCSGLTSVTIPASVTSIGQDAFYYCNGLTSVTIYAKELTTYGENAFYQNQPKRTIYVFGGSVDTYETGWPVYENYIVEIPAENLAVTTPLNANPQAGDEYWSTYYHPAANVKINTSGVEIYKATLNEQKTSVTLTKVEGNVIKAGQAVMLKATTSGTLSMELTPDAAEGDFTDNDLKGGNTVQDGYDAYTLAAENSTLGFYKFSGTLNGSKAHLEIPQGSTDSRSFIGLDGDAGDGDATRLVNSEQRIVNSGEWHTLSGARLSGKPTRKGIYVVEGRKEVVR